MDEKDQSEWSFSRELKGNHIAVFVWGDELKANKKNELKELIEKFLRSLRPDKANLCDEIEE